MTIKLKIRDQGDYADTLSCPVCNENYLHQGAVTVYSRGQDSETVVATRIAEFRGIHSSTVLDVKSRNPSLRRDGLRIEMECEHCGEIGDMLVYQHKGCTFLEWDLQDGFNPRG